MVENVIKIGKKKIGGNNPCFLIAEVGTTCLGDIKLAFDLIDVVKDSGAHSIKFQIIDPEQVTDLNESYAYEKFDRKVFTNLKEMFQRLNFKISDLEKIVEKCKSLDIEFFATVDFIDGVDLLEKLGVNVHKMGAWDITHRPLVEHIAKKNKPLFIDLGPSTKKEFFQFRKWFLNSGGKKLLPMHDFHTQEFSEMNMKAISYLRNEINEPIGFSSPAKDNNLDIIALSLGAKIIEKRLTISKTIDAFHVHESLEPKNFSKWVEMIKKYQLTLGVQKIIPSNNDLIQKKKYYRFICAKRDIKNGEKLTLKNIDGRRTKKGVCISKINDFLNKRIKKSVKLNQPILHKYLKK
jgi:sialic acid synthase SpsE